MHIALTEDQERFRLECREYFESVITPEVRSKVGQIGGAGDEIKRLDRQMGADGWLGAGWPKEYGGRGFTPIEQFLCFDESMRAGAPINTLNTIGPPLMEFGSPEQKRLLPPAAAQRRAARSASGTPSPVPAPTSRR